MYVCIYVCVCVCRCVCVSHANVAQFPTVVCHSALRATSIAAELTMKNVWTGSAAAEHGQPAAAAEHSPPPAPAERVPTKPANSKCSYYLEANGSLQQMVSPAAAEHWAPAASGEDVATQATPAQHGTA